MNQMSLRNNQLRFETSKKKLPITNDPDEFEKQSVEFETSGKILGIDKWDEFEK
jgi:hypothetical protein